MDGLTFSYLGVSDSSLLRNLCQRHGLDEMKLRSGLGKIAHACGTKTIKGEERDVVFARSSGSTSTHVISMGADGVFYCSCPAWIHGGGLKVLKPCKHIMYVLVNKIGTAESRLQYYV